MTIFLNSERVEGKYSSDSINWEYILYLIRSYGIDSYMVVLIVKMNFRSHSLLERE